MFLKTWATDFNLIGHEHDLNWQASIPLVVFPLPTSCLGEIHMVGLCSKFDDWLWKLPTNIS